MAEIFKKSEIQRGSSFNQIGYKKGLDFASIPLIYVFSVIGFLLRGICYEENFFICNAFVWADFAMLSLGNS